MKAKNGGATSRSETVLITLRSMIERGEYPAGFHLQEVPLAESFEVSRTPVRVALSILAQEGLLDPGPKRGYKVRGFSVKEVLDAYEARASLESTVCRHLAERGLAEAQIRALRELLELGDQLLDRGSFGPKDQGPWSEMNHSLHSILMQSADNTILQGFIEQTYRMPLASAKHVHWYRFDQGNFDLAKQAHTDHHNLVDAIINRQSARAEALMREHIYLSYRLIKQHFSSQRVGFDALLQFNSAVDGRVR